MTRKPNKQTVIFRDERRGMLVNDVFDELWWRAAGPNSQWVRLSDTGD